MIFLNLFLVFVLGVWVRRAVLMMGSIRKYSIMPVRAWESLWPQVRVSVIVPCRNESRNLPILIPSLMAQDYPHIEFIFLDDRSTDNTLELLRAAERKYPNVKVIEGALLPGGWTGKNHAMHQCAQAATGDWLLFSDADTEHLKNSVSSSLRYALERNVDLLTLTARCVCKSFGEHLVQPMGIGCFAVWFKLEDVNDPNSSVPLACGQYLLVKKAVFEAVGGAERIKDAVTEDLALFKNVKAAGYKCELAIGAHIFATRMYQSFKESWVGWRRIYLHALDKNVPSLVSKIFMLIFFSAAPFFVLPAAAWRWAAGGSEWALTTGLAAALCAFILFLRSRSHVALKASQWSILLHPLSALAVTAILIDCLKHHFQGRKVEWKQQQY
ncbi:MAG: glycosyltransferase [Candidatus Omnitrophica bacterium]|jgi:chlorobactene glucosyltransferase|nr:glycosyltransferase [Candidatus Omnitrophota bacterium]